MDGTPIFIKKIPLTDLERQPEHILSTANLFDLPLFYQYGVGSGGFGAWRELVAHIMTTNWILSGDCPNFPILYHWRTLPTSKPEPMTAEQEESLERDVQYWENSPAIRNRLEAKHTASAHVVLFLEYIPQTLYQWLGKQLKSGEDAAEAALSFVDEALKSTNDFINARGLVHFDAHFENILADDNLIYFSDFGLALSSQFDLTKAEFDFLNTHRAYDRCATIVNFLHCVITHLFGKDQWEVRLKEYMNGKFPELAPSIDVMIKQYAPIALTMDEFYRKLQKESKLIPYPATHLKSLLAGIEGKGEVKQ
jgi:serine/threonine protein kinase